MAAADTRECPGIGRGGASGLVPGGTGGGGAGVSAAAVRSRSQVQWVRVLSGHQRLEVFRRRWRRRLTGGGVPPVWKTVVELVQETQLWELRTRWEDRCPGSPGRQRFSTGPGLLAGHEFVTGGCRMFGAQGPEAVVVAAVDALGGGEVDDPATRLVRRGIADGVRGRCGSTDIRSAQENRTMAPKKNWQSGDTVYGTDLNAIATVADAAYKARDRDSRDRPRGRGPNQTQRRRWWWWHCVVRGHHRCHGRR